MTHPRNFQPGKSKKCWCGSGRKAKNCHGVIDRSPAPEGSPTFFERTAFRTALPTTVWSRPIKPSL
ncbi:MAG: SEC-C domain-containing protein [Acidobacteriaceae bacterium]|nr:SEC-C domain-containing protein [Acidobacteriaceae bacterium]MBV9498896.1 SEC-C domain-containing protein [Acidobacteriaceae bacterium]